MSLILESVYKSLKHCVSKYIHFEKLCLKKNRYE